MTAKERVLATLNFELPANERIPRQLWMLPWAEENYPGRAAKIRAQFPGDIIKAPVLLKTPYVKVQGDPFAVGSYTDEWGCVIENRQRGIVGEVKDPIVKDWNDLSRVHIPEEAVNVDIDAINAFCREADCFVLAGAVQRPFERIQFIRSTEELFMDLVMEDEKMLAFLKRIHEFHLKEMEAWSRTDVDGLYIADDWGTQTSLLIRPELWRKIFKPLYKDYIDLAHAAGKKIFMHSDGYILDIYPDLIESGLDAINSQIFCMGLEKLSAFKGKITFWGEMDRQRILPFGTEEEVFAAVRKVYDALFADGGVIAQCDFGPGVKPENISAVFAAWNSVR